MRSITCTPPPPPPPPPPHHHQTDIAPSPGLRAADGVLAFAEQLHVRAAGPADHDHELHRRLPDRAGRRAGGRGARARPRECVEHPSRLLSSARVSGLWDRQDLPPQPPAQQRRRAVLDGVRPGRALREPVVQRRSPGHAGDPAGADLGWLQWLGRHHRLRRERRRGPTHPGHPGAACERHRRCIGPRSAAGALVATSLAAAPILPHDGAPPPAPTVGGTAAVLRPVPTGRAATSGGQPEPAGRGPAAGMETVLQPDVCGGWGAASTAAHHAPGILCQCTCLSLWGFFLGVDAALC